MFIMLFCLAFFPINSKKFISAQPTRVYQTIICIYIYIHIIYILYIHILYIYTYSHIYIYIYTHTCIFQKNVFMFSPKRKQHEPQLPLSPRVGELATHSIKSFLLMLVQTSFDQKILSVSFIKAVILPEYQEFRKRISSEKSFGSVFPHKRSDCEENALRGSYLQCTTIGPASGGLQVLTLRKKARKGVGCSGTP